MEREEICCHAQTDGDCNHLLCPQIRDDEPAKSGRHCPLDRDEDGEWYDQIAAKKELEKEPRHARGIKCRGESHIQSIKKMLRQLDAYTEAEIEIARVNAVFALFVKPNIFIRIYRYVISKLRRIYRRKHEARVADSQSGKGIEDH